MTAARVPADFARHDRSSGLTEPWEPLYSRRDDDGTLCVGLVADPAHCNTRGFVHGGLLAALADNAMGASASARAGASGLVTVSLSIDYLGSGAQGDWVEVRPAVLRTGRRLCFVEAHVIAVRDGEERTVARASATFARP